MPSQPEGAPRRGQPDAVEFAVLAGVDWLNNRRLLEPLDYVPPAEYESAYYQAQSTPPAVAGFS